MKHLLFILAMVLYGIGNYSAPLQAAPKTQARPSYLDEPAEIFMVGEAQPGKTYPLMVFLPFTTSNAANFYQWVKEVQPVENYIALVPQGTTERDHYLPDFMSFISWYETRLLADIELATQNFPVDTGKIIMQGFSLGGDLGWALMIRQRDLFAGAVMFGTRCSYTATKKQLEQLKALDRRFFFGMGTSDAADRRSGMEKAHTLVRNAGIRTDMELFEGGHEFTVEADYWQRVWKVVLPKDKR